MIKNYLRVLFAIVLKCKNWPSIIFAKLSNTQIEHIVLRNGFLIYINDILGKADLSMFSEIFFKQYYNPKGFEIQENDVIFDVGANTGFFTFYASQKNKGGRIYTFEPLSFLTRKIRNTLLLNNVTNVQIENIAIGAESAEQVPFYISKDHNGCHSLYERKGEIEKILVTMVDFKKYCQQNTIQKINFLKLDCEGAEYDILNEKNIEFIKNTVEKISMEYHDDISAHTHEEIVNVLTVHNFTVTVKDGYLYALNNSLK